MVDYVYGENALTAETPEAQQVQNQMIFLVSAQTS
jgi:hypothetical protein